jgi:hypothetical protein
MPIKIIKGQKAMRKITPEKLKEKVNQKRDLLINKKLNFSIFKDSMFLNIELGRFLKDSEENKFAKKKFKNVIFYSITFLTLYTVVTSLIFTIYSIKRKLGIDIFPNIHFFH